MLYKINDSSFSKEGIKLIIDKNRLEILDKTINFWNKYIISCKEIDKNKVENIINREYKKNSIKCPNIVYSTSPFMFYCDHKKYSKSKLAFDIDGSPLLNLNNKEDINVYISAPNYDEDFDILNRIREKSIYCNIYNSDSTSLKEDGILPMDLIYADYLNNILRLRSDVFHVCKELILCGVFKILCFKEYCLIMSNPVEIHIDENGKLHSTSGEAVKFSQFRNDVNDSKYYVHGKHLYSFPIANDLYDFDFVQAFFNRQLDECLEVIEENKLDLNIPIEINLNSKGLLHSETDYAIKYKNGNGSYFINGKGFHYNDWQNIVNDRTKLLNIN